MKEKIETPQTPREFWIALELMAWGIGWVALWVVVIYHNPQKYHYYTASETLFVIVCLAVLFKLCKAIGKRLP